MVVVEHEHADLDDDHPRLADATRVGTSWWHSHDHRHDPLHGAHH
ncbi:hypothetical protein ABZX30_22015 [Streptomyces sp. NPDC004542]